MQTLIQSAENLKTIANSISEITFKNWYTFSFDCSYLPVIAAGENCWDEPAIEDIFYTIQRFKQPVLYWFTICSHHDSKWVYDRVLTARKAVHRKFPALYEYAGDTNVLYVGKVNRDLASRMITHFGYDERPDQQGLQLFHWARNMGLKLELNCILLPQECKNLTYFFESQLSQELKPLIGKY